MKVLQINAVYGILSTGRICLELHDFLEENGHKCVTIYGNSKGDYQDTIYVGNFFSRKFHALLSRVTGKIGYYSKNQTIKVISYIETFKPDIVHLHNLHANFISIPFLLDYLGKNNIPTVVTMHDCFFYTGACTHYTVNNCYKWEKNCYDCKFNDLTWFFDKTEKMFDDKKKLFNAIKCLSIVGVSDWITKEAKTSPIFESAKIIKRIYNGIDLSVFKRKESGFKKEFGIENKKIILGVAGGWSNRKGLDVFCKLNDLLGEDEKIVLVGNVKTDNLPSSIIHIPTTNNVEQLVDIYNTADVFVQASREETFGKVVAEALACGIPVVTNNSTANPELVDERCGIIVYDFNLEKIYKAIKEVFKNGKEYYSDKCIEFAKEHCEKSENLKLYLKLYEEIICFNNGKAI